MTLMITRTTRRTAIATLLFFGGQLSGPAAWAQAPSPPAAGAPSRRRTGAPATPATPTVVGSPRRPRRRPEPPLAARGHRGRPDAHRLPAAGREVGRHAPPLPRGLLGRERGVARRALRRRLVLRAGRGGQGQPARRAHRLQGRQGRVPVGARPGRRVPEVPRAAPAPRRGEDLARPGPGRAGHHRGPEHRRRAAGGQERPAARHLQHGAGPARARGRQARVPPGRGVEPPAGRQHVGGHPGGQGERQALPAGARGVVRGEHPRRPLGPGRSGPGHARPRHADRGQEPAGEPPRRPRLRAEGGGRAGRAPERPRQHGAGRAGPDPGPAGLRAHRGNRPPPRPELVREHPARHDGPAPLPPPLRAVVPERVPAERPVGVRGARQASRRVRQDFRDAPAGRRARLRPGHAAGQGSAHRQQHSPDCRGRPEGHDLPGHLRRGAEVPARRGHVARLRAEHPRTRSSR